jgi:hypothetical protein
MRPGVRFRSSAQSREGNSNASTFDGRSCAQTSAKSFQQARIVRLESSNA